MIRDCKKKVIDEVSSIVSTFPFVVLVRLGGVKCVDITAIRVALRQFDSGLKVTKNTLARVACCSIADIPAALSNYFVGSMAVIYSHDVLALSKYVVTCERESDGAVAIVCALHEGSILGVDQIKKLASMPSLEVIRANLVHVIGAAVPQKLLRLLGSNSASLLRILKKIK